MKIIISLICVLNYFNSAFSQITFREVEKKDIVVARPEPYDSLNDFQANLKRLDYKQYIGLQIFLPPISNPYSNYNYQETGRLPFTLYKTNSSICDVSSRIIYKRYDYRSDLLNLGCSNANEVGNRYYTILDFCDDNFTFLLRDNISKDSMYFIVRGGVSISPFILVPYFVKQKQLYDGKKLVFDWISDDVGIKNIENCKRVKISYKSEWTCEVTLLKIDNLCNLSDKEYSLFYVLKNAKGETISLNTLASGQMDNQYRFILENDYLAKERKRLLAQKEIATENQRKIENDLKQKELFKQKCINQFGQKEGELIAEGKVILGMTQEMCKIAWGTPWDKNKTTTDNGTFEQWFYSWRKTLYFQNEILKRIDE